MRILAINLLVINTSLYGGITNWLYCKATYISCLLLTRLIASVAEIEVILNLNQIYLNDKNLFSVEKELTFDSENESLADIRPVGPNNA